MTLRLEYFDHNDAFASLLPKGGTVDLNLKSADGSDWVLFHLESPVEYQDHSYEYFLLKSRWAGYPIGGQEPASVFILLVPDVGKVVEGFNIRDFDHVAWGMVHTVS